MAKTYFWYIAVSSDRSAAQAQDREPGPRRRQRLSRQARNRQLLEVAWGIVRAEGTEGLTLGRLAERAEVSKPVVYDHFATRPALLAALYRDFDDRQIALMDEAIAASAPTLEDRAAVIAAASVDCVLAQGREIPGVVAALASSPELEQVKRSCDAIVMERCRAALAPFAPGEIALSGLRAMLGAAEALSYAAAIGEITAAEAQEELAQTIVAMVGRASDRGTRTAADRRG